MHRAEHIAYLRQMARHHGQHEGQRQKECGQHDIAGRRRVFGFHLFPPVTAPQKNKKGACQSACKPTADPFMASVSKMRRLKIV